MPTTKASIEIGNVDGKDGVSPDDDMAHIAAILAHAIQVNAEDLRQSLLDWQEVDPERRQKVLDDALHIVTNYIKLQETKSASVINACTVLLQAGADPNSLCKSDGCTVLHRACKNGNVAVAQFMLDAGCSVEVLDKEGLTPLRSAVNSGQRYTSRLMLRAGADPNLIGAKQMAMCDQSLFVKSRTLTWLLLAYGAKKSGTLALSKVYKDADATQAAACAGDIERMYELMGQRQPEQLSQELPNLRSILQERIENTTGEERDIARESLAAVDAYHARMTMRSIAALSNQTGASVAP